MSTVQLFRREALNFARFDEIDRKHRDANIESIFYYAVFYPAIEAIGALAAALIIWYGGGSVHARHADARRARRVPAVLAAVLPADQRHVGEVQRPAVGDGLVGADLQAARRAGRASSRPREPAPTPAPAPGHIVVRARLVRVQRSRRRASRTGCCGTSRSRSGPASASASSARPARARRRSSTCCCGSTTCSAAGSRSTASTSASWTSPSCGGCSASCCRTCICSRARSPTTSGSATRRSTTSACARAARAVHADAFIERLPRRLRGAGRRARRDAVGRAEAAAVVRARAGLRSARADPRRGDVERRHRDRAAHPRRAARR